jgi:hypothetical protein
MYVLKLIIDKQIGSRPLPHTTQWFASPACTELEAVVMDWAAKMFGLHSVFWNVNEVGGGVIQVRSRPFSFARP